MTPARRTGRPCSCCSHPDRDAIDRALVDPGAVMPVLSRRFGVGENSLLRHRRDHLPSAALRAALATMTTSEGLRGLALVEQAERLRDDAVALRAEAIAAGDRLAAVRAAREARGCVELLARLAGEVGPEVALEVNVVSSPAWLQVQAAVLGALLPHPVARAAVAAALAGLTA